MKRFLLSLALAASLAAWGQSNEIAHPDPKVEARLKSIAEELRCLVCQNQTIADSNAPLALDLRQQTRSMIAAGKTDDEIRSYMVDRYGDFVLYKPPFNAATALLWVGPGLLILLGFAALVIMIRRRNAATGEAPLPDAARRREIEALLQSDGNGKTKA
ncbi:MAG: cytochrome c-type biogenesis protein CcmH [Betaproteobacteria bacterium]|nr:cytochrome c-type biogenesis protein CcmH [Betaproteobacteria bacterium]